MKTDNITQHSKQTYKAKAVEHECVSIWRVRNHKAFAGYCWHRNLHHEQVSTAQGRNTSREHIQITQRTTGSHRDREHIEVCCATGQYDGNHLQHGLWDRLNQTLKTTQHKNKHSTTNTTNTQRTQEQPTETQDGTDLNNETTMRAQFIHQICL